MPRPSAIIGLGHGITVTNQFDTFSQTNYTVEAEDFDYEGGQFLAPWAPEGYSGLGAVTNVDFHHTLLDGEQFTYRSDGIPEDLTHDYLRAAFLDVGARDYDLTWFGNGDWASYTRVYPAGTFYVYGRFSGLNHYSMELDQVTSGAGSTNQVTTRLGRWTAVGRAYNLYDWVLLTDDSGAPALVTLGDQTTLRMATTGNSNPNFFMLVPAPASAGLRLTAAAAAGQLTRSFRTQSGVTYQVLTRDDLRSGTWSLLRTVPGDGSVNSVTDLLSRSARFYQVTAPKNRPSGPSGS